MENQPCPYFSCAISSVIVATADDPLPNFHILALSASVRYGHRMRFFS